MLNVLNKPLFTQFKARLLRIGNRTMCELSRVFVRSVENEERMQIRFRYHPDIQTPFSQQRVYNFDRLKTEGLDKTIGHIATKINSIVARRVRRLQKKNKLPDADVAPTEVCVSLNEDGSVISSFEPNASAWTQGRCLQIEDRLFRVCVNVPTIRKMSLPQPMMVGFSVYANINLEFGDIADCEFTWYRVSNGATVTSSEESGNLLSEDAEEQETNVTKKCRKNNKQIETKIGVGRSYIPTADDVGCQLKLECTPIRAEVTGEMVTAMSSTLVIDGPAVLCPFEKRHRLTERLTSPDWFVMIFFYFHHCLYLHSCMLLHHFMDLHAIWQAHL